MFLSEFRKFLALYVLVCLYVFVCVSGLQGKKGGRARREREGEGKKCLSGRLERRAGPRPAPAPATAALRVSDTPCPLAFSYLSPPLLHVAQCQPACPGPQHTTTAYSGTEHRLHPKVTRATETVDPSENIRV